MNASATVNTSSGLLKTERQAPVGSRLGQRASETVSVRRPPRSAPVAKSPICGSKIRKNLPNANYSNLPLL
jgi:hypothetical protein